MDRFLATTRTAGHSHFPAGVRFDPEQSRLRAGEGNRLGQLPLPRQSSRDGLHDPLVPSIRPIGEPDRRSSDATSSGKGAKDSMDRSLGMLPGNLLLLAAHVQRGWQALVRPVVQSSDGYSTCAGAGGRSLVIPVGHRRRQHDVLTRHPFGRADRIGHDALASFPSLPGLDRKREGAYLIGPS